ncbi:MAG: hypothetical protein HYR67_01635 [Bacteroidetes bacterium]|nr:hypothetical protein [Bacteroidota bacterium]
MIKEFELLAKGEQELLLKAPAIVSILAASASGTINDWEKADAIKLARLKTFSAHPLLIPYYKEVEKVFEQNFEALIKRYSPFDDSRRMQLRKEVDKIDSILAKVDHEFAVTLHSSLSSYADHVKKAYKGLIVNFIFPYPIAGLTE